MPSGGDNVIRRNPSNLCKHIREHEIDASRDLHRSLRGKYPREGYVKGVTNPLSQPKDERRPPPLRGC